MTIEKVLVTGGFGYVGSRLVPDICSDEIIRTLG
jgi:nucleoside-diphosphate-sugar epimerase